MHVKLFLKHHHEISPYFLNEAKSFEDVSSFNNSSVHCILHRRDFWAKLGGRRSLLIVQCDSTDQNVNLVACSRHLLIEEFREVEKELGKMDKDSEEDFTSCSHVLMIVQLPRVAGGYREFDGVQGEEWLSVHIDELCPPSEEIPPIEALLDRSVSEIFEGALNDTENTEHHLTIRQVLTSCVQMAASKIEDDESTLKRATRRIELLLYLLSCGTSTGKILEIFFIDLLLPPTPTPPPREKIVLVKFNCWLRVQS